jgi:hypothetical protein
MSAYGGKADLGATPLFALLLGITLECVENVGSQFLSLRQSVRVQHSPPPYEAAEIANNRGTSPNNLSTVLRRPRAEILSLGAFVSKPLDFADLVRNS